MTQAPERTRPSLVSVILSRVTSVVLSLVAFSIPLLAVWLSTSLAVYLDGPLWLAIVVGLLMFPVAPILWEVWSDRRRKRKQRTGDRLLTRWDRLVLRTLAVNLALLLIIFFGWPRQGFTALSTRGDWMLGGSDSAVAETVRGALFDVAGGLEWLYSAATSNPYARYADEAPLPEPSVSGVSGERGARLGSSAHTWPMPAEPHPAVRDLPASVTASLESVGRHIKAREGDPFLRVKAIHDFVTTWLDYDAAALASGAIPPQDAAAVFAARKAVCAGYSRLMVALGEVTGDRIVYITGHSRGSGQELDGVGHAWNAAEIDGAWYLIDATWDAGFVSGDSFTRRYGTDYLFTPPAIFGLDHLPDDAAWQLRADPISRGEFVRQPALSPRFFALGLELVEPTRSHLDTRGGLDLVIHNPHAAHVMVSWRSPTGGEPHRCNLPQHDAELRIRCDISARGTFHVEVFANDAAVGTFSSVGYIAIVNRG